MRYGQHTVRPSKHTMNCSMVIVFGYASGSRTDAAYAAQRGKDACQVSDTLSLFLRTKSPQPLYLWSVSGRSI